MVSGVNPRPPVHKHTHTLTHTHAHTLFLSYSLFLFLPTPSLLFKEFAQFFANAYPHLPVIIVTAFENIYLFFL